MPNPWRLFADLLPALPLLLAEVVVSHSDDTATVQLLSGGLLRVRRGGLDVTDGTRVLVRDGRIEGPAPTLPYVDIEI